jgi:hypothetical protein
VALAQLARNPRMRPTGREEVLIHLIVESSELIKFASKALRFGMHNWHPETKISNAVNVLEGMRSVIEAIEETRAHIPRPLISYMVSEALKWCETMPLRYLDEFTTTEFSSLSVFSETLGNDIIEHFSLNEYIYSMGESAETIAQQVIEELWRRIKND